eukprot:4646098-Amphidinium_carterae.2
MGPKQRILCYRFACPPLPVNEPEAHQQSSVSSLDSSSEASLHKDAPEENIDEIRWILPKGSKYLLHTRWEESDGVPLCRKSAFAWGLLKVWGRVKRM